MPYNFSDALIEVFPNINNLPTAPTATKAGNGSHLIEKHNSLIDKTTDAFDVLESQTNLLDSRIITLQNQLSIFGSKQYWKLINSNYDVQLGDKLIINNAGSLTLNLPNSSNSGLVTGFYFELIKVDNTVVTIGDFNTKIMGATYNLINLNTVGESMALIYVDENIGWIPNRQNMLILTIDSPYGS